MKYKHKIKHKVAAADSTKHKRTQNKNELFSTHSTCKAKEDMK